MKHFSKIQKQNDQYIYSPIDSINHRSPKAPKSCSWLPYSILSRPYRTTSIARQKNSHMYIHWKLAPFPIGNMRLFFFDLAHKFSQNGATSLKISRHTDQFLRAYFSLFSTQRICITPKSFRIIPINRIAPIGPLFQHLPSEKRVVRPHSSSEWSRTTRLVCMGFDLGGFSLLDRNPYQQVITR